MKFGSLIVMVKIYTRIEEIQSNLQKMNYNTYMILEIPNIHHSLIMITMARK
ncbi:hypothetical protein SDC9_190346 [bioreactor metagenome]|uniref:Uncharacterized protein n=1 Tax=bioreactor metagenome TaxID=1076179 RepID=A0A645HUT7_9ZZZZ